MAQVVIALGSNLDDPRTQLRKAKQFLQSISDKEVLSSPIYSSEPIGPSKKDYLNALVVIESMLDPVELFEKLKVQEKNQGRPSRYPKWTARTIDMDIIAYDDLVLHTDSLIIPHNEYTRRLFVLLPLRDVLPDWKDPKTAQTVDELIEESPMIRISKTKLNW